MPLSVTTVKRFELHASLYSPFEKATRGIPHEGIHSLFYDWSTDNMPDGEEIVRTNTTHST